MDECLEGLQDIKVIVDDIVCFGRNRREHDKNLKLLMDRCRQIGLKLNSDKMKSERQKFQSLIMY
ncbi:hypothetical protein DPMN_028508 [Dreissena polymorpha]|uniref:Reverse transcriptase domain-containing protein n=1 Tax=Dreissena polymorpha TaxID=45954 RepID=A0A9D4REM3_DREPO|nr:hypothetical protein DPMN_028508 [Dreissena polymorpha]